MTISLKFHIPGSELFWDVLLGVTGFLAAINFGAYLYGAFRIGGDAFNGKVVDSHYFVGDHGIYTEVTRGVFLYSEIHSIGMICTHALFLAVAVLNHLSASERKLQAK